MQELSKQTYVVDLSANKIYIILNSLDESIENHRHLMNGGSLEKAIVSIQNKLEPINAKHTHLVRKHLFDSSVEIDEQ